MGPRCDLIQSAIPGSAILDHMLDVLEGLRGYAFEGLPDGLGAVVDSRNDGNFQFTWPWGEGIAKLTVGIAIMNGVFGCGTSNYR